MAAQPRGWEPPPGKKQATTLTRIPPSLPQKQYIVLVLGLFVLLRQPPKYRAYNDPHGA